MAGAHSRMSERSRAAPSRRAAKETMPADLPLSLATRGCAWIRDFMVVLLCGQAG
jgi:hypothetical protein